MKPTAVSYTPSTSGAVLEFARATTRFAAIAYAAALTLALGTFAASTFAKEIVATFGHTVGGVRAVTFWEAGLLLAGLAWLATSAVALLCTTQKGRTRRLGVATLSVNAAAMLLALCTMF